MADNNDNFDLIVIGGGSGGNACAKRAATYGARVLVVEKDREGGGMGMGGTCVNMGCVPKKVMFNAAFHAEMFHSAKVYGFNVAKPEFSWEEIKKNRDALIERLRGIYESGTGKVTTLVKGTAKFVDKKTIEVNGTKYSGKNVLIAVGGVPAMPDVPGMEHCIDSDGFFRLEHMPKKVALVGAGYIAVELAGVFNALGADTTLFIRGETVLRKFDPMIQDIVTSFGEKSGIKIVRKSGLVRVDEANGIKTIVAKVDGEEKSFEGFECVVVAIGRKPNTSNLGLDVAGVNLTAGGFVEVDPFENTSAEGVLALGDCTTTGWELTPVAIAAGRRLADRLFGGEPNARLNYDEIPSVVFSHPTVGTVGITEGEAVKRFGKENLTIYTSKFVNLFYAMHPPEEKPPTAMKIICEGANERVVGIHVVGLAADEMMQGFGVAVKMGCTKRDLDSCVAIHPTASEELVTMGKWGTIKDKVVLPVAKGDSDRANL